MAKTAKREDTGNTIRIIIIIPAVLVLRMDRRFCIKTAGIAPCRPRPLASSVLEKDGLLLVFPADAQKPARLKVTEKKPHRIISALRLGKYL